MMYRCYSIGSQAWWADTSAGGFTFRTRAYSFPIKTGTRQLMRNQGAQTQKLGKPSRALIAKFPIAKPVTRHQSENRNTQAELRFHVPFKVVRRIQYGIQ